MYENDGIELVGGRYGYFSPLLAKWSSLQFPLLVCVRGDIELVGGRYWYFSQMPTTDWMVQPSIPIFSVRVADMIIIFRVFVLHRFRPYSD